MRKENSKAQNKKFGKWKKTEHDRFMKALEKYGKNWIQVQKVVKTRSLAQVRSHAQKMLTNLTKYQKRIIQMNDFQRMADFCKIKESGSSQTLEKHEQQEPQVKKEENYSCEVKRQFKLFTCPQDSSLQTNQINAGSEEAENFHSEKFCSQNFPYFNCQVLGNQIFPYEANYPLFNPCYGWQFMTMMNPLNQQEGTYVPQTYIPMQANQ